MIEIIAFILSILGIILNAKKNDLCWILWIISCFFWIYHFILIKEWILLATWVSFLIADIYGLYQWRKTAEN